MIPVRNIYYMLAYAFEVLNEKGYKDLSAEEFPNAIELLSAILDRFVSSLVKRGLVKDYLSKQDNITTLRGRILMPGTIRNKIAGRQALDCDFDEFITDMYLNQVLKTTVEKCLLPSKYVKTDTKKRLKRLMEYFRSVETLNPGKINWNINLHRNNNSYKMPLFVCQLIVKGLIQSSRDGTLRMQDMIDDEHMAKLYEKFILNYYKREHKELNANASKIMWALEGDAIISLLPEMRSDITLSCGDNRLIIDAKYYEANLAKSRYDSQKVHNDNLYQIFTYVKNLDCRINGSVSGMLLYAKTESEIQPNFDALIAGNRITVMTLDLNQKFEGIAEQLNYIANKFKEESKQRE